MANTGAGTAVPRVTVSAKMTSMTVSFTTPVKTRGTLALSFGSATGLQLYDSMRTRHVFKLSGLQPGAMYRCTITTVSLKKKTAKVTIPCATKPLGPAVADVRNGRFYLDGSPTFLLMATAFTWCPDDGVISGNRRLGVFVLEHDRPGCQDTSPSADQLHSVLQGKMLWYERQAEGAAQMAGLPELADFPPNINLSTKTFLVTCSASSAEPLYDVIRAREKPVVSIIPVATHMSTSFANCIDGKRLQVLFWTAASAGAGGIQYVTQFPWNTAAGVQVKPDLVPTLAQLSRQIAVLGPALLGGRRTTVSSSESSVKAAAFTYGGATYLIASNTGAKATRASFKVNNGGNRIATHLGGKSVKLKAGSFTVDFGSFDVNIYRIPPVING